MRLQKDLEKKDAKERKLVMENQEQSQRIKQLEKMIREQNRNQAGGPKINPNRKEKSEFNNTGMLTGGNFRNNENFEPPMPPPCQPQTMPKNASKNLTLKQLKDVIKDMYEAKVKFDLKCD